MSVTDQDPEEWIKDQQEKQFQQFQDEEVVGDHCDRCELTPDPIIYRGSFTAELMIAGEFLRGVDRDQKEPFSGELGELLDRMINAIDRNADRDCYVTNALLCGGESRDLSQASIEACHTNLHRQIELVDPDVVLALGKYAYCSLYGQSVTQELSDHLGHQGSLPDFPWIESIVSMNPLHVIEEDDPSRTQKFKELIWSHLQIVERILDDSEPRETTSDQ